MPCPGAILATKRGCCNQQFQGNTHTCCSLVSPRRALKLLQKTFLPCADTLSHSVVCQTINHGLICRCFMDSKFFLQKHRNHPPLAGSCVQTLHWNKKAQTHNFSPFHARLTLSCWPQIHASWGGNHTVLLSCQLLGVADLLILIPSC